jgi:hypothetical protein
VATVKWVGSFAGVAAIAEILRLRRHKCSLDGNDAVRCFSLCILPFLMQIGNKEVAALMHAQGAAATENNKLPT